MTTLKSWFTSWKPLKKSRGPKFTVDYRLGDELFDALPLPSDNDQLEILSSDQAERLLRGGIPLQQKRIQGDLIIGQRDLANPFEFEFDRGRKVVLADLPRPTVRRIPVNCKIEIEGCLFEGRVIFAGLWLQEQVRVATTAFRSEVDFQLSKFDQSVIFHQCRFRAKAKFSDAVFEDDAHFDGTHFEDLTDFYHSTFGNGASFKNAIFHSQSNFSQSEFNSSRILEASLDFRNCICYEAAFFAGAKFQNIADFRDTQFRRQADFSSSIFHRVNFSNTEFLRLDIKWEQIAGEKLLFGDIVLEGVDPSRPVIDPAELDKLFERRVGAPLEEKHRQYDILRAIFTKQGDYVSADACFYEWKQVERRQSALGWNPENWIVKTFHYLNWLSCGYGVRPIRTLLFALVLILSFTLSYTTLDLITGKHIDANRLALLLQPSSGSPNALLKNLDFSFRAFMNFGPIEDTHTHGKHSLLLVERTLGWLTLFLFVTTYTRMTLR